VRARQSRGHLGAGETKDTGGMDRGVRCEQGKGMLLIRAMQLPVLCFLVQQASEDARARIGPNAGC